MSVGPTSAIIIGASAILAGFLIGGRYTAVSGPRGSEAPIVYIVDRFTGNVWFCGGIVCKQSGPITN